MALTSDIEIARRRDEVIRRMANTPPQHKALGSEAVTTKMVAMSALALISVCLLEEHPMCDNHRRLCL